jgi:OmpA-OmpF porin, OOP family
MKSILLVFVLFLSLPFLAQDFNPSGTWQGVMLRKGTLMKDAILIYFDFKTEEGHISGFSREEIVDAPNFSVKKLDGDMNGDQLEIQQIAETKSHQSSRVKWCKFSVNLTYNPLTGYMTGEYVSTDCRNVMGDLILYRMDFTLSQTAEAATSQLWFDQFKQDYAEGLNAPEIRRKERENFVFEPIYFDYDKFDIRAAHNAFLDGLIKVVKGHSDLRIKVTGHTDSDGSLAYNDSLSMNRARAITDYFVKRGIRADRLVIDFKGERSPIDSNESAEGKQRNRRVDFDFI